MQGGAKETELLADPRHQPRWDPAAGDEQQLLFIYHRDGVQRVVLRPNATWIIGREPPSDVLVRDGSLSRQHARLFCDPAGELTIQDLDSTNGTSINGVAVPQGPVRLGDLVTLGAVTLALHLASGPEGEPVEVQSHDRFLVRIAEELCRARTFRRTFALLMVRATSAANAHVSRQLTRISPLLRPIDHLGLYASDCIEVLLPEASDEQAIELADAIARSSSEGTGDARSAIGVGLYPRDATSAGALLERCREVAYGGGPGVHPVSARPPADARISPDSAEEQPVVGARMREVYAAADRVAESSIAVLILGETGVGKEVLAQRIHARSGRRRARFIPVNCGAIAPQLIESTLFGHERGAFTGATERRLGVFETADGGTILLDEIGELPAAAQVALLRALDTKRITRVGASREIAVDVRVLAATHRDLEAMVQEGGFRQDLLFRLNTMVLKIPPLRERPDEVEPLARRFIAAAATINRCEAPAIDEEALSLLRRHRWPGNVRELRNVIERAVVICQDGLITADDLPASVRAAAAALGSTAAGAADEAADEAEPDLDFKELVQRYECDLIVSALRACDWNQSAAARRLRIPRRTLVHKMKAFGLRKLGYAVDGRPGDAQ